MATAPSTARVALWRNRDYRLWWLGSLTSGVGNALSLVAYPLIVLAITGSPLQAGVVGALEAVPYALFSLPAGVLADRLSRRMLLVSSSLLSTVSTAWIPIAYVAGILDVRQIYLVALLNGAAGAVFQVTQVATIPQIVSEEQLGVAAGQSQFIFNLSSIVGPPLAGILLSTWLAAPMLVDAVTFAIMGLAVLAIRLPRAQGGAAEPIAWRTDLTAGLRRLAAHRPLRAMMVLTVAGDMLFAGIAVLMTVLLEHNGASAVEVGLNFSLAAVGGIVGSLAAHIVERRVGTRASIVGRSWATALLFPLFALSAPPFFLGVVWCVMNVMIALMNVVQMRYIMTSVPKDFIGRFQSIITFLSFGVLPVGVLLTGFLLQFAGPRNTVLIYSAVLLALAVYSAVNKGLRSLDEKAVAD